MDIYVIQVIHIDIMEVYHYFVILYILLINLYNMLILNYVLDHKKIDDYFIRFYMIINNME